MLELSPILWWRRLLGLPNDAPLKALIIAVMVAAMAATVVSITAVTLKPRQLANIENERQARMQAVLDSLPGLSDVLRTGDGALDVRLVNLATGSFAKDADPVRYDPVAAAADPSRSTTLPPEADIAGIKRRANLMPVYILRQDGKIGLIVLPVHGVGYQSTIYAYLALTGDLEKVAAFTVYKQSETPGLGARITDANWQAKWVGKHVLDDTGALRIAIVRGQSTGPHEIDGITGATRTTSGINNMLRFWLGEHGFGPFLTKLQSGEASP